MQWKLLLILLAILLASSGSCIRGKVSEDYMFTAMGTVLDDQGHPIADVNVKLQISAVVYQAITPLKSENKITNENGEFVFQYISGDPDPPYTLTFEKAGFEKKVIEQATQDMNPHRIILNKTIQQ